MMRPRLRLDVLIPTRNRASMLERCLGSVLRAAPADGLDVHVTVVCNACSDESPAVVAKYGALFPGRVSLVEERRQGKSKALNAGIAATSGELVGMIDDDEEVAATWVQVIAHAFDDAALDFIGGPYVPMWDVPTPAWMPRDYLAVVGAADNGAEVRGYGRSFPGILKGGNAVIRRRTLDAVGGYAEYLGPGACAQLFSCEDEDMYWRLLEHGAIGKYIPELVIYHYISANRLTRAYYRRWCFWRGVSRGLMDRRHPLPVTYFAGVPRFVWGRAARALGRLSLGDARRAKSDVFTDELRLWDLAGYAYGRHLYTLARFAPVQSRRTRDRSRIAARQRDLADPDRIELAG